MQWATRGYGFAAVALGLMLCGCGGAGQSTIQPPPPQADFAMALSASSLSVQDGGTSAPVTVSVTAQNGFSGSVQVTLSNLPAGISSLPASPFAVSAGQTVSVIFGAGASAATGQFSVTAQGASGALAHNATLSLSVQAAVAQNLSKSTFIRDDSVAALDHRAGEPVHRHIVFDAAGQRFFVANRAMNRVEVFAAGNPALQATLDAPGASSVDLSADGKTLWVGTELEQLLGVDTGLLQVRQRVGVSGLAPIPNVIFNRPTEVYAMVSGKLLVRLRQPAASQSLLALWDPGANVFTDLTSAAPGIFQAGAGVLARSGDQTKLFVAANDASGEAGLFDGDGKSIAAPQTLGAGNTLYAAANQDGSRFAVVFAVSGATQLLLLDGGLNLLGTYAANDQRGVVFSADGQTLYVGQALGGGRVVTALSVSNLQATGEISDLGLQSVATVIEGIGETKLLCGLSNRGVSFLDASAPAMLSGNAPEFAGVPAAQPSEGPNAGGTAIVLSGSSFAANPAIAFAGMNAVAGTGSGTQIAVTSPPSAASGAANVTAYFSNGWVAMAPAAFSYGPSIERVFPNTASKAGGDTIEIYGFGFGNDAGKVTVKIGGNAATVQKVENFPAFAGALGAAANYPFTMERLTVTAPGGAAGKADVLVQAPSGSASAAKALQFLAASTTSGSAGLYKFILYDQARQFVYMTATDHVALFDLHAQAFRGSIEPPPNGPPPDAALRGLAMTPDGTQLVVADFGAQSIYLISPDGGALNGAKVPVGGVPGFLNSGPARVAATSAQTVFVGLSGEGAFGACNSCLGQMNLMASPPSFQPAPQPEVTALTGAPLLQANGSGDTVFLAFASAPGGPVAAWSASAPNSFAVSSANDSSSDLTSAGDGTMFAMRSNGMTEIRAADLTLMATPALAEIEGIAGRVAVPGITLHPTGALVYEPFLDGPAPSAPPATGIRGGVDIRDAHSGQLRLRVYLPEPFAMLSTDVDGLHGGFLTVDENGQKLFAITNSGLTVVQLANVPLGVGSLAPAIGAAAGGTSVTLRGSGFVPGTRVTIAGKPATATYKDMNTLQLVMPAVTAGAQRIALTNPDGESVGLDAAYLAQ